MVKRIVKKAAKAAAKSPTKRAAPAKARASKPATRKPAPARSARAKAPAAKNQPKKSLQDRIQSVLTEGNAPKLAALATVTPDGNPWVRTMVVRAVGLTLFSATSVSSRKVTHIKRNPNVALTLSLDSTSLMSPYVVIDASVEILTDAKTKKAHWNKGLSAYFRGPDDPNYCVLKYNPRTIEYMGEKGPELLKVD